MSRVAIVVLLRPFNYASYLLGQKLNLVFGVVMVTVFLLAGMGWLVDRWRTRHQRGKHAALHRVLARRNRDP